MFCNERQKYYSLILCLPFSEQVIIEKTKTWSSCIRYSCSVYVSFMYGSSLLKVMAAAVWAAKGRTQTSKQDKALYDISQWLTLFVFMKLFSFQKINPLKCLPSFVSFQGPIIILHLHLGRKDVIPLWCHF